MPPQETSDTGFEGDHGLTMPEQGCGFPFEASFTSKVEEEAAAQSQKETPHWTLRTEHVRPLSDRRMWGWQMALPGSGSGKA
jgi:hypothetical protein